jgi:hypothetical protein
VKVILFIKKLKLAIRTTKENKPWGLAHLCRAAKLYKKLNKATTGSTIVVTKNPRLWKNDWRK